LFNKLIIDVQIILCVMTTGLSELRISLKINNATRSVYSDSTRHICFVTVLHPVKTFPTFFYGPNISLLLSRTVPSNPYP